MGNLIESCQRRRICCRRGRHSATDECTDWGLKCRWYMCSACRFTPGPARSAPSASIGSLKWGIISFVSTPHSDKYWWALGALLSHCAGNCWHRIAQPWEVNAWTWAGLDRCSHGPHCPLPTRPKVCYLPMGKSHKFPEFTLRQSVLNTEAFTSMASICALLFITSHASTWHHTVWFQYTIKQCVICTTVWPDCWRI